MMNISLYFVNVGMLNLFQGLEVTSLELTKCKFEIQVLPNILTGIPH